LSMPDPSRPQPRARSTAPGIPASHPAHHPSGPAELQLSMGRPDPYPWTFSAHQALLGSSFMWNNWSPTLLGPSLPWCETATSTSMTGTPSLGQSWPQLYRLPR
jgi:hypothetical protein